MARVLHLLLLWLLVRGSESQGSMSSGLDLGSSIERILPSVSHRANASQAFYGIMFDAGSTGTRIHVYSFIQREPNRLPILDNEVFQSVKPGLSAYADMPEKAGDSVRQLLEAAKSTVPHAEWNRTPVMLKATAGLRMLPPAKAHALLQEVQDVFDDSPFYVPDESVSIMNGTSEGVLAWVTVNFLTGHLYPNIRRSVGILDLGGGSTQVTFLPKKTTERFPADYTARLSMFNTTYKLYTHSYSGNGIKAAQLAAIGALGSKAPKGKVFQSSCLPKNYKGKISFGGVIYKVSGKPGGSTGYKSCYREMLKVVKGVIQEPEDMEDSWIYAFSYYFDHAVEAGLVDEARGGAVQVRDFRRRAKEVCNKMSMYNPDYPFLCMDLTYITCLLKSGYGFEEETILELTKKLNNVEASWALGATLSYFQHFSIA
ncbi:ectonucleoside triphosphate diphosphohydrolase 5 [Neoarius graeffei]|uniref:ectonucleoside triphosphate diphosphohydrolase 5 n=1 Tax=Neoarius graeffei TaxID=443677 RepID=UPI00298C6776|nr:ectonucleoside triphosphate diphosphohydrolase 5 [Neoarius graeffei]